jgi:hypothetical protein
MGGGPFDPINGQGGKLPMFQGLRELPGKVINMGLQAVSQAMQFRFGGLLTYEKPIIEFFGDVNVAAATQILMMAGATDNGLPRNCVGVRFINLVPGVIASINGGPFRTILNGDSFQGCEIRSLQVVTDGVGSCTIQAVGTGD